MKFARVGYGSDGRGTGRSGEGYTYVVNDNVRTKDVIQVISTSMRGRKFATTGMVKTANRENSVKGQKAKQEAMSAMRHQQLDKYEDIVQEPKITTAYSGKELGVPSNVSKYRPIYADGSRGISQYAKQVRAGNIEKYMQENPNAEFTNRSIRTYDEYSKKFLKGGK